jgi:chemotaxis protein MotB
VTAMMAFFLLMWLINTTTPEQKRGIADYFAPQSISQTVSGSGGVLGGKVMGEESAHAGGAQSVMQKQSPPSPNSKIKALASGATQGGAGSDAANNSDSHSAQDGDFNHAAEAIRQAVQDNPDLANLSHQLILEQTPEGLRIQLVDQDGRPMFQQGTDEPMPYTKKLLAAVGAIVDTLPNRVSISGHTAKGDASSGEWELSSARANAARSLLQAGGLSSDRIYEVAGKAESEPLLPEDPAASANRRLSIVLLREAPPVPDHSLQ